jgi:hypothetical protein
MRDACWLQSAWSATITPKGAFFCEVAAALDMLFDGPGGWPIEPGWWKRKPDDFGEQLNWCEYCGFALNTFMRESADEIDDVSPTMYKKLEEIESPGLKSGRTHLLMIKDGKIQDESRADGKRFSATQKYVEHYEDRFCADLSILYEHEYDERFIESGENYGLNLNHAIKESKGWLLLVSTEDESRQKKIREEVFSLMHECILNPGTLHIGLDYILMNKNALSIKRIGFDRIAMLKDSEELIESWDEKKVITMEQMKMLPLWSRKSIRKGDRYAIWGMGVAGSFMADAVKCSGGILSVVVDHDSVKWDTDFYGTRAHSPEYLIEHPEEYDHLLIAHYSRFDEIYAETQEMGISADRIIMPYEV